MQVHKIDKGRWAHYLAPLLRGRAQLAFAALPTADSTNYDEIKKAILQRYDINEEAYQRRFRSVVRGEGESNREHAVRLLELEKKWLKKYDSEKVYEAIGLEQFLNTLPVEKRVWVYEKKPDTCIRAGELADEYEQVWKQQPVVESLKKQAGDHGRENVPGKLVQPGKSNSTRGDATAAVAKRLPIRRTGQEGIKCFGCEEFGHMKKNCPNKGTTKKVMFCREEHKSSAAPGLTKGVRRSGLVEGQEVQDIPLDTGCTQTMMHSDLVLPEKFLEGDTVVIKCAHGDVVLYPLANVEMEVDGLKVEEEAAASGKLPVAVLLGKDVPGFHQLLGNIEPSSELRGCQEEALVVVTRARTRRQLEEELLQREKELLAGANLTLWRVSRVSLKQKLQRFSKQRTLSS